MAFLRYRVLVPVLLLSAPAMAAPMDTIFGLVQSTLITAESTTVDAQGVRTRDSESFVVLPPGSTSVESLITGGNQFSSALTETSGNLEVGAVVGGSIGSANTTSVFEQRLTTDLVLPGQIGFEFSIPAGEIQVSERGPPFAGVRIVVDYRVNDVFQGALFAQTFDMRADSGGIINGTGPMTTQPRFVNGFQQGVTIDPFIGQVFLPSPTLLTDVSIRYRMEAFALDGSIESSARAFIGDPLSPLGGGSVRFFEAPSTTPPPPTLPPIGVAEPSSLALVLLGLATVAARARRRATTTTCDSIVPGRSPEQKAALG